GPRYFAAESRPKAICSPYRSRATTKYGYATAWVRKRIRQLLSLERREVRDELVDLFRFQQRLQRRHDRLAAHRKGLARHHVGVRIRNRFAYVLLRRLRPALIVRTAQQRVRSRDQPGHRRTDQRDPLLQRVAAEACRRRP